MMESLWRPPGAILLDGPLGVGKTTLIQAVLARAGVPDRVKSPTFDLVHPHRGPAGLYVHVDLYRLDVPPPPEELDVDDRSALVLVEWGAPWTPYFPDRLAVRIDLAGDGRRLTMEGIGTWGGRLRHWASHLARRG
jgi:tRNA threonylcarbamoyladenosine biosynthesis protein TsaE